jgi:hypothetical protein
MLTFEAFIYAGAVMVLVSFLCRAAQALKGNNRG